MPQAKKDFEFLFFERLVEKNPNFVDALLPLAEMYTRKGFLKEGYRAYPSLGAGTYDPGGSR